MNAFAKYLSSLAIFFMAFAFSGHAQAQLSGQACANPITQNPEVVALQKFPQLIKNALGPNTVLATFTTAGLEASGSTMKIGRALAGVILLIVLFAELASALINNKPIGPIIVGSLLVAGIVMLLLNRYGLFMGFGISLAETLNATVGGTLSNALFELVTKVFTIIGTVMGKLYSGWACMDVFDKMGSLGDIAIGLFFIGVALVLILLAFSEILFIYLLGPILIAIGIATGPLFIALLMSKFTKPFFDKWLAFMFSALIIQFLALLVIKLMASVMSSTNSLGSSSSFAVHAIAIAVIAHMLSKVFTQIPGIASGLTGGKTGAMGAGNSNPVTAVTAAATGLGLGGARSAASSAASSASGISQKVQQAGSAAGSAAAATASNAVKKAGG